MLIFHIPLDYLFILMIHFENPLNFYQFSFLTFANFLIPPSFMHWLLILNASTNFLIYCFMGNKFKTVLMAMVRDLIKGKEQSASMVMIADAAGVKREISKVDVLHDDDDHPHPHPHLAGNNVNSGSFTNSTTGS